MALTGPCEAWATEDDIEACVDLDGVDADVITRSIDVASELLWVWTGKLFGTCVFENVRPCADYNPAARPIYVGPPSTWAFLSRTWEGSCGCNRSYRCGCSRLREIRLSYNHVQSVEEVKVDGVIINAARYRIDDGHWLVRLPEDDGTNDGWPCCQDLELADTEDDTFSVSFTVGIPVPESGILAAANLAAQLISSCTGGSCALPARVTAVTRLGTSFDVNTIGALLDNRRTGIEAVDYFLEAYGVRKTGYGSVTSPDENALYRITG